MTRKLVSVILVAVAAAWCLSALGESRDFGKLNRKAPPETAQYAFLIGAWDCTIRTMRPDGQSFSETKATWSGHFILDGWAIQDYWVSELPNGKFQGTNIRSFNPQTRKWDNRWLSMGNLQWKYFESEMVGDTMVMTGGEGEDPRGAFIDRNT